MMPRQAIRRWTGGPVGLAITAFVLLLASPLFAPQLLAFPHKLETRNHTVWSERPIDAVALASVLDRADALVAASPIGSGREARHIFLTDGGWRWTWLANTARGSFGFNRPVSDGIIILNRSDVVADRITNGRGVGGTRRLSGVIAHEITHGMVNRHVGRFATIGKPQWLVEGYCDFVAQESALSPEQAAALDRAGKAHPALPYFHGRRKVAAILADNGGDVDALFAESR